MIAEDFRISSEPIHTQLQNLRLSSQHLGKNCLWGFRTAERGAQAKLLVHNTSQKPGQCPMPTSALYSFCECHGLMLSSSVTGPPESESF